MRFYLVKVSKSGDLGYKSKFKLSVHQKKPFKAPQSPKIKSFYIFYKKFTQHKTYNFNLKSLKVILKNLL